jgi:hypothetical protein
MPDNTVLVPERDLRRNAVPRKIGEWVVFVKDGNYQVSQVNKIGENGSVFLKWEEVEHTVNQLETTLLNPAGISISF